MVNKFLACAFLSIHIHLSKFRPTFVEVVHHRTGNSENGEGKRRNEFAQWHVAWLAERHNYAEFNLCKMAQRNKLNRKACARLCHAFVGAKFEGAIAGLNMRQMIHQLGSLTGHLLSKRKRVKNAR